MIQKARADFDKGEYRWVAEAMKHVVFADPTNKVAKALLADTYEQLGYQAESGPWRSVYLQGAYELRHGTPTAGGIDTASPDTIRAMSPEMLFEYWGVRINAEKAAGKHLSLVFSFSDLKKSYSITIENGVLSASSKLPASPGATITLTKPALDALSLNESTPEKSIASGAWKVTGKPEVVTQSSSVSSTPSRSGSTSSRPKRGFWALGIKRVGWRELTSQPASSKFRRSRPKDRSRLDSR